MAGDPAAALDHAVGRAVERLAAHQQRARAAGAAALRQVPGVALVDDDLLRLDAQLVGEELAVGGEVALAVRLRADPQLEGAVCAVAALCYAEMAAMVPVSGSAYT